jgi:hypothetical protein
LLSSIVLCASAERPPSPPQRTVAEIIEVLIAPPDPRAAVSRRPLVESLRSLPPVAMHALVLTVRGAIAAGEELKVSALVTPSAKAIAGDYMVSVRASGEGVSESANYRVTVTTSPLWGGTGIAVIIAALLVLVGAVGRFGRR